MKPALRDLHFLALAALALAGSQCFGAFSLKTYFNRAAAPYERPFAFRAADGFAGENYARFLSKGAARNADGLLVVEPGGVFGAEFPAPQNSTVLLDISAFTQGPAFKQRITVVSGGRETVLCAVSSVRDRKYRLTSLTPGENFRVLFEPAGPGAVVFIEKLALARLPAGALPYNAAALPVFLLFLFFFFRAVLYRTGKLGPAWLCSLGACALLFTGAAFGLPAASPYFWLAALAALAVDAQKLAGREPAVPQWLALTAATGAVLRWNEFQAAAGFPLAGDAWSYYFPALKLSFLHPFDTGYREPFYIWLQKIWMALLGPNEFQFRLLTVALSVGIILASYLLFAELLKKRAAGLLAAFFVAVNNYGIFSSALGERTEAYLLALLLFCYFAVKYSRHGWAAEAGLVCSGAALCLTWLIGGVGAGLVLAFRWFRFKIPARRALASAALLALLVSPHLLYERRATGDMFHVLNKSVNYFKSSELSGVASNQGAKTTWLEYLKGRGGLNILKRTAGGYAEIFLNPASAYNKLFLGFHYTQWYSYALFPFYLAGLAAAAWRRRVWLLALLLGFTHAFPYNLADIRDPRLIFFMSPFFAAFLALGFLAAWAFLAEKLGPPARKAAAN